MDGGGGNSHGSVHIESPLQVSIKAGCLVVNWGLMGDKRSSAATENLEDELARSALLQLPPEVRNMIYRYALIEPEEIVITPSLKPLSLLSTCAQIRSEATTLWYGGNVFQFNILHCDTALLRRLIRYLRSCRRQLQFRAAFIFQFPIPVGVSCWDNLEAQCRAVHAGDISAITISEFTDDRHALSGIFEVMDCAQEVAIAAKEWQIPWTVCEKQLKALRLVAGHADTMWRQ